MRASEPFRGLSSAIGRRQKAKIELIKDAAEEGLQLRDFPTAFRKIETAALKAMAANPQSDEPV
jgi:hypothetical protein